MIADEDQPAPAPAHTPSPAPPPVVLAAFGLPGPPVLLTGGQGTSFRAGDAVLKPADADPELAQWYADTFDAIKEDGFRVSRPLRTKNGGWVHEGWTASRFVPGEPVDITARAAEIITAGRSFHRALAGLPRPDALAERTDWWAVGNRVAWQEQEPELLPQLTAPHRDLLRLAGPPPPPSETSQLVHGDLGSGNVLFAPGLAPAVIDFSPYWRPPGFAEAVVAGDAVVWHEAGVPLLRAVAAVSGPYFAPYLARAVIFRLATANERMRGGNFRLGDVDQEAARYRRAVRTLEDFTAQRA